MFAVPINDSCAIAVTKNPKRSNWRYHLLDFELLRCGLTFKTKGAGSPIYAAAASSNQSLFVLAKGCAYFLSRKHREIFKEEVIPPRKGFAYDITRAGERYYVAFGSGALRYYDPTTDDWHNARSWRAKGGDEGALQQHPDLFKTFVDRDNVYALGAFGLLVRVRGGQVDEIRVADDIWFVDGGVEDGGELVVCSDHGSASIYRGTFDHGFERIFEHENHALHKTALHQGVRYIGAAAHHPRLILRRYPDCSGQALFTLDRDSLTEVRTGCTREPGNLHPLLSTGRSLWAVDEEGIFRHTDAGWELHEFRDIRRMS